MEEKKDRTFCSFFKLHKLCMEFLKPHKPLEDVEDTMQR